MSRGRVQTGKAANFRRLETGSAADPIRPARVTGAGQDRAASLGVGRVAGPYGRGGARPRPPGPGRGFSGFKRRPGGMEGREAGSEAGGAP
jgi:hypothetical protein